MAAMNDTIRNYIKRRVWWCLSFGVAGWLLVPLGRALGNKLPDGIPRGAPEFAGVLLFVGAMLVMQRIVKCPKCNAQLGRTIAMPVAFGWGSGPKVNFCPYCGVSLDEPRPHAQTDPVQSLNPIK